MPTLAQLLAAPVTAATAATDADTRGFLEDLQANILKGHGRDFAAHIVISFAGMAPDDVAALLRTLAGVCTSAGHQLRNNHRLPPHLEGGTIRCLFLSANGYRALGPHAALPPGVAFSDGMRAPVRGLNDPAPTEWDPGWSAAEPIADAMFLVADSDNLVVTQEVRAVTEWLGSTAARVLTIERGRQQHRVFAPGGPSLGVEHFGYVDGRSQPLFLQEDIDNELASAGGANWRPGFPAERFIVPDPNGRTAHSAGSFFVFRKLEQNVLGFRQATNQLAAALGLAAADAARAGAMVVGRFQDGTPLTLQGAPALLDPPNDFNYAVDAAGLRCPFHAHIRKTNPRGDLTVLGLPESAEREPIMARRGITYGCRDRLADDSDFADAGHEPTSGVGLLFMAYMRDIEAQFEFTQKRWANNPNFAPSATGIAHGIDPVIGQGGGPGGSMHIYQDGWTAGAAPQSLSFASFVTMKGGEYFFAPSLSFLRGVGL